MKLYTLLLSLLITAATISAGEIVIVNTNNEDNILTKREVQQIYLGRNAFWENGDKIVVTTYENTPLQSEFMLKYLNKSGRNFMLYWKQLMFTGRGVLPQVFSSEEDMIEYIANTSGAIGYISESMRDSVPEEVTILEIEE